jgi:hypothetical protein
MNNENTTATGRLNHLRERILFFFQQIQCISAYINNAKRKPAVLSLFSRVFSFKEGLLELLPGVK